MLRPCSKQEFFAHIDFAYGLASDLKSSGYPTYCDGIKTKAMFVERSLEAFERETEDILLFKHEGEVRGLIHYYLLPEERYLSTAAFCVGTATEQALSEFLSFAGERFPGFDLYLGFPAENVSAVTFLAEHGFECIESACNNTAFLDECHAEPSGAIIRIGRENYGLFRALHAQVEDDMYWNSERMLGTLDRWVILAKEEGGALSGAVYYTEVGDGWFEIFGVDTKCGAYDHGLFTELLSAAEADAKRRNGRVMTFFCDDDTEPAAQECGFVCVGNYRCYKAHLASGEAN